MKRNYKRPIETKKFDTGFNYDKLVNEPASYA